ncbi:SusC/RagA family TonB-linked outer membrane protein [Chryseobacterium polytrichastri]|uniref:TonB-linked outer membrane protein, SusC/RagA family n=1 Tax=Chryseobacterium polytrichastri TaxID=1302687 RepID=A0A1M7I5E0_9FLAO|nr:TonB-dependent receptor [Chryseobacterium polytrichastri]SHM36036.1 TonB-linked outer membrane protein, SusC/RagA family [Chryseobacterium polytrichastri]
MNVKITRSLGLVAVLYFTANFSAQKKANDTLPKEQKIEEVVMIGYGTQKKSNVTGAISSIKASDIENSPTAGRPEQIMQGRAAGVSVISNSGQPGTAATVRVRGITSFGAGGNDPLWVVDGIVVDNIGWLNQSDIEGMEILKDGASAAIYGVSAAKGVVLITTKKGVKGRMNLSYNGFFGVGSAAKKLDLLNGSQYATIMNEAYTNEGKTPVLGNPASYGVGTDWQKQIFNSAQRQSHEFSISGGNDKSTFYSSFGYYDQEGIVLRDISNYKRINARLNSTHKVFDFLTIGQTFAYTHTRSQGVTDNGEFGGPLSSAINLDPLTPVVVTNGINNQPNASDYINNPNYVRDPNGNPYGISQYVSKEMSNPLAFRQTQLGRYKWSDDIVANVYADLKINKNISFKTSMNGKLSYWGNQAFTPTNFLSSANKNDFNSLFRQTDKKFEWNTENTLTYQNKFGLHSLNILLGQGYYEYNISSGQSTTFTNLPVNNWQDASFNFDISSENKTGNAWDGKQTHKASYFGRVVYDYDSRYLFTGTVRRDGSSKFGRNNHWGTFPAMSLGWNVSNESFWPENKVVNSFKLRGGYGVLGNDAIDDFQFANFLVAGSNYTFGDNIIRVGYAPSTLENPDLKWERTSQFNIAADLKIFRNFDVSVDVYRKKSTDILRRVELPGYLGLTKDPFRNVGDMNNDGIEVSLGYKKNWGDFGISANGNFGYLKNEITRLEGNKEYVQFAGFQTLGNVSRLQVGQSYGSFYGYQNLGVFQNQAEIDAYKSANGAVIQPNAKPGDFKRLDANGDGKIDEKDFVNLGNSVPKYTFGFTLNMNYKNFDLMIFAQGQAGNKIFQGLRRLDIQEANYQTSILDRWTGEGTSNSVARVTRDDPNQNYTRMSDYYLQNGDYLRIKLVQIGYTLSKDVAKTIGASKIRFYVTGENLVTFTKYTGYDPEIAGADTFGIDRAFYPQARTFLFGANVQF